MTLWLQKTSFFYINLLYRTDRDQEFRQEITKMKIPPRKIQKIYASMNKKGFLGCAASHLRALQLSTLCDSDFVLIFEDDFQLTADIDEYLQYIDYFWENFSDANVLMLQINPIEIAKTSHPSFFRVYRALSAAAYMVKKSYLPSVTLNVLSSLKNRIPVDVGYTNIQNEGWYTIIPTMGKQRPSYSDIEKKFVNYGL